MTYYVDSDVVGPRWPQKRQILGESFKVTRILQYLFHIFRGYPGFSTAVDDRRPDNPPPYEISGESGESYESAASVTLTCACGTSLRAENAQFSDVGHVPSLERHPASLEAQPDETSFSSDNVRHLPRDHVASNITLPRGGFYPRTIIKPSPPPYDFVVVNSAGNISYLYDSPPPYGDFV